MTEKKPSCNHLIVWEPMFGMCDIPL